MPAKNLNEIHQFTRLRPVQESDWDQFVNTDQARDSSAVRNVMAKLLAAHDGNYRVHSVFAGHQGCGKSTELVRLSLKLQDLYDSLLVDVAQRYSLPTLDYRQLLFLCAEEIIRHAAEVEATPPREAAEALLGWFDETAIKDIRHRGYELEVQAGGEVTAKADYSIPFILKIAGELFAKFYGKIFSGGSTREEATRHIEQRLDDLMHHMDIVVRAIEAKIAPRRLLLLMENLDKVEALGQARELFFDHRLQLISIPCSVIFTFPIRLWYEPDGGVEQYEDKELLPMIPVRTPPSSSDFPPAELVAKAARGRQTLREILHKRIDPALIDDEATDLIVEKSGGVIRDAFIMLREAAVNALVGERSRIELGDAQTAVRKLRASYVRRLGPPSQSSPPITLDDIEKTLGRTSDWPRHRVPQTPTFRLLLQNLFILEYDGDIWHDLHPVLREHMLKAE